MEFVCECKILPLDKMTILAVTIDVGNLMISKLVLAGF
jgi:hypothetical protein